MAGNRIAVEIASTVRVIAHAIAASGHSNASPNRWSGGASARQSPIKIPAKYAEISATG